MKFLYVSLISLALTACGQQDTVTRQKPQSSPPPDPTASLEGASLTCTATNSNELTCTNSTGGTLTLPLPATFPNTKDCNACLTRVVNGTASVECPNGLSFSFLVVKGDTGAAGKDGGSCSVGADGWVRCADGTAYQLRAGPKGDAGTNGTNGSNGSKGDKGEKGDKGDPATCSVCGCDGCWSFGAHGNVYTIPNTTTTMPNLDVMTAQESVTLPQFNYFDRLWSLGFPNDAARVEWFAVRFTGYIEIPSCPTNLCKYRLTSDDGAKLYIDGSLVINNDGLHAPTPLIGGVYAVTGWHRLLLDYWQGPRTQIALALEVSDNNGSSWRVVDVSELKFQVTP